MSLWIEYPDIAFHRFETEPGHTRDTDDIDGKRGSESIGAVEITERVHLHLSASAIKNHEWGISQHLRG
jgi:hypothetical protein